MPQLLLGLRSAWTNESDLNFTLRRSVIKLHWESNQRYRGGKKLEWLPGHTRVKGKDVLERPR